MVVLRWAVRFHKWLALLVGLQILLWVLGGVVMSLLPIEQVRAEHTIPPASSELPDFADVMAPLDAAALAGVSEVRALTLTPWLDRVVYRFETPSGVVLADARSGQRLSPIGEDLAVAVARAGYAGAAPVADVEFFHRTPVEYRRPGAAWRVSFDDGEGTRLYVSPVTGEITARRNDIWRVYDFFWMLHIMDYRERESFNHPLIISVGLLALVTVLAGFVLLFIRVRRLVLISLRRRRRHRKV